MSWYWLVIGSLAVWRITHLLQAEDGPWDLVVRVRVAVGEGVFGRVLDCFYCLSVWIAAPFAWFIGQTVAERLVLWPALSGAAIILERLTARSERTGSPSYVEDQEEDIDGMLRK